MSYSMRRGMRWASSMATRCAIIACICGLPVMGGGAAGPGAVLNVGRMLGRMRRREAQAHAHARICGGCSSTGAGALLAHRGRGPAGPPCASEPPAPTPPPSCPCLPAFLLEQWPVYQLLDGSLLVNNWGGQGWMCGERDYAFFAGGTCFVHPA